MFDQIPVRVAYANLAKVNRLRAWARKHGASIKLSRYARDAYEGTVNIAFPWNKGRSQVDAEVAEVKAILFGGGVS